MKMYFYLCFFKYVPGYLPSSTNYESLMSPVLWFVSIDAQLLVGILTCLLMMCV